MLQRLFNVGSTYLITSAPCLSPFTKDPSTLLFIDDICSQSKRNRFVCVYVDNMDDDINVLYCKSIIV